MFYGDPIDRSDDSSPKLSDEEQSIVSCLSNNFVMWVDLEEIMLGMAGIRAYYKKLGESLWKP